MDVLFVSSMPAVGALSVEVGFWGSVMFSAWRASKPTPPIFPESELVTGSEALPMLLLKLHPLSMLIHFFFWLNTRRGGGEEHKQIMWSDYTCCIDYKLLKHHSGGSNINKRCEHSIPYYETSVDLRAPWKISTFSIYFSNSANKAKTE